MRPIDLKCLVCECVFQYFEADCDAKATPTCVSQLCHMSVLIELVCGVNFSDSDMQERSGITASFDPLCHTFASLSQGKLYTEVGTALG